MKRADDFENRREHLRELSDEELLQRFWKITEEIVTPIVELASSSTSPSIERSVLLRMGFSSIEANEIVKLGTKWGLLGKGMGNAVITYGKMKKISYLEAGEELSKGIGWEELNSKMRGEPHA